MAKSVICPEEFIAEVNKRLPDHHAYKPGMRVFLVRNGATSATTTGYDSNPKKQGVLWPISSIRSSRSTTKEVYRRS
jgi:hypothetical protein